MQLVSRQRIGKHVPAATNMSTTIQLLLETVFAIRPVQSGYKQDNWGDPVSCQLTESVESQPVKRRLGGRCEVVAGLRVVSREYRILHGRLKIEPQRVNLKNRHS
jgi:hypothetical protein